MVGHEYLEKKFQIIVIKQGLKVSLATQPRSLCIVQGRAIGVIPIRNAVISYKV